jgi:ectoine hydroxylase-related dioxygenase (phytanoyl-CoA dioxygenase family)
LHIVQQVLNPTDASLASGNFGRHNFEGNGPDGSPQPLRVGPMGGIIALPGSADQAIHADTPHLYELYDCLPAHYVNAFCLGAHVDCEKDCYGMSTGATPVGGTAFIHASHKLSFTASLKENWSVATEQRVLQNLVRPSLEIGDLLLFDCRILHFGLANSSKDVERPLLYTNLTQAWFHDPKNWDDREAIFQAN